MSRGAAPGPAAGDRSVARGLLVDDVTVRFGATTAVDRVSLQVAPGEVLALLGPSGCGKSTLLRVVAGLQRVDAGRVLWGGADLGPVPVHRRGFGLMFQDGQLFAHRDVAGNVAFGLQMARVPAEQRRARISALLELVGLTGYERRSVTTLSGGEQQRVALARALAPRPRLLLLDEPLTGLDRLLRERLAGELAAILRHEGAAAIHVTHDQDEAFAVADRVAVMAAGRLLQVDTPRRLWAHPSGRAVAEFLGYTVLGPVVVGTAGGPAGQPLAVEPGAVRVVGRADDAWVAERASTVEHALIGLVLGSRARRGGGTDVDVRLGPPGPAEAAGEVATLTAGDDADRPWRVGDVVRVAVDLTRTVALPPE